MITAYFDIDQFMTDLEEQREARGLTWYNAYRQTGVYGLTLEAVRKSWLRGQGTHAMSVYTMATLATWAGLKVQNYIKEGVKV